MHLVFLGDSLILQSAGIKHYNDMLLSVIEGMESITKLTLITPVQNEDYPDMDQVVLPIKNLPGHQRLRQFTSIPRVIKDINPDLVIEPAHFGPFRLPKKIKRCTVIHDLTPITHPHLHPAASSRMHRLFMPKVIDRADLLLTNSQATADSIAAYRTVSSKILPLYYPIREVDHSTKSDFLLAIGTIEPRKDLITVLKGFEIIASKNHSIRLKIAGGKGWKNQEFYQFLSQSKVRDRVDLLGYVDEETKFDLLSRAKVLLAMSITEGLGIPLLEAIERGLPIVCSDIPSFREIGGELLDYVPVGDYKALSLNVEKLLREKQPKSFIDLKLRWRASREKQIKDLENTLNVVCRK